MTALLHFFENLDRYDLLAAIIGCVCACVLWLIHDIVYAPIFPQDYDMPRKHPTIKAEHCQNNSFA